MDDASGRADIESRLAATGVRMLTAADTRVFEGTFSLLHCAVAKENVYRGVFAVRMFPVRHPDRFISLHYTDEEERDQEIGVIVDLGAFAADQQRLIRRSLQMQYQEQIVRRVFDVRSEFGLLFFDVETQRGRTTFVMPWRGDRAEDYGDRGKVLLDAVDNRFIIPDVSALPAGDRLRFCSFVYW